MDGWWWLCMHVWKYRWIVVDAGSIMKSKKHYVRGSSTRIRRRQAEKMNRKVVKTSLEGGKMVFLKTQGRKD